MLSMNYLNRIRLTATAVMLSLSAFSAQAAINLSGTRFIFNQNDKEITVQIHNEGDYPVLLQSWIDDGHANAAPEKMNVPFVLTPPLTRVEAKHGQTLRINSTGDRLPEDRESVFWLNVLEIPPASKDAKNRLMVAFRNRVKLFWRPAALSNGAQDAPGKLTWRVSGQDIELRNPTPYYISLTGLNIVQDGHSHVLPAGMIAPSGTQRFSLSGAGGFSIQENAQAEIIFINDYGAEVKQPIAH
ncbi:TPA: fimbrial biogenesis chaperone [Enterobacter hormaechei]